MTRFFKLMELNIIKRLNIFYYLLILFPIFSQNNQRRIRDSSLQNRYSANLLRLYRCIDFPLTFRCLSFSR